VAVPEGEVIIAAIVIAAFVTISGMDLLPLNCTVQLNTEAVILDEMLPMYEASELVFSVKSVTRQLSILG